MSEINAKLVNSLREKTGAGLMDCKKALIETAGDLEAAVDFLRKKGTASAAKKADREAKEGVIAQAILSEGKVGVLVEVNCETDFVAKNDHFRAFCDDVARKLGQGATVESLESDRVAAVQKIGENVLLRRHAKIEVSGNGGVAAYIHTGGKVGVLVEVGADKAETIGHEDFKQLVRDITLQIAAANPVCISRESVPAALAEREREVYRGQVPPEKAKIADNIVEGKMNKFYSQVCLVDQAFIKNPDQSIKQLLAEKSKALGDNLVLRRFIRYMVGEEVAA